MRPRAVILVFIVGCSPISADSREPSRATHEIAPSAHPAVTGSEAPAGPVASDAGPPLVSSEAPWVRPPYFFANVDPEDDLIVAPPPAREDCASEFQKAFIVSRAASIPVHREGKKLTCGSDQLFTVVKTANHISYNSPPTLTCTMALALARTEAIATEEALRIFGKPVVKISQIGTYSCREMAAYPGWVSEHSYANAIDLESFTLSDGREISVAKHFERGTDAPKKREGEFLRVLSRRLYDEGTYSNVLTPFFDRAHWNHFHLDMSRYRTDGTRPL